MKDEVGDKIVCVNSNNSTLELFKTYTIRQIYFHNRKRIYRLEEIDGSFYNKRFITFDKYRKLQMYQKITNRMPEGGSVYIPRLPKLQEILPYYYPRYKQNHD